MLRKTIVKTDCPERRIPAQSPYLAVGLEIEEEVQVRPDCGACAGFEELVQKTISDAGG